MKKTLIIIAWVAVVVLAVQLRTDGLYRGLATEGIYHPDEPKQVVALSRYLQGKYLWRVGSLFYDGYPYGLNHLDEWILRPVLGVRRAVVGHFAPDRFMGKDPSLSELYYLARTLRCVYGLLAVLLCLVVARRLSFSKPELWYAALLLALAPVSISVSHFATGDIGTDLFSTLMLLFLCLYAVAHRCRWLFLTGMAVGMSFACKYNGLLSGGAAGLYLIINLVHTRDWKSFLRSGVWLVVGVAAGIVLLTPALLLEWGQTSDDICANFVFIRNYGSGGWWEDLSATEKLRHILFNNFPRMIGHIGWCVVLSAAAGLIFSCRATIKAIRTKQPDAEVSSLVVTVSILAYPFVALFLSLAGKPEVQPFHFSYLQMPFILGAVYGIVRLGRSASKPAVKGVVVCLAIASIFELGSTSMRNSFFWKRQDNGFIQHQASEIVFSDNGRYVGRKSKVRKIFLETESASVFRNRRKNLELHGGALWRDIELAPVPSIPYPADQDWIFMNGPVFPRNERMFKVPSDTREDKHVVFYGEAGRVVLGVRSGSWPVEVRLKVGGEERAVRLAPHSQIISEFEPSEWRTIKGGKQDVCLVPLGIEAAIGDAYVTVLARDVDIEAFRFFGGDPDVELSHLEKSFSHKDMLSELGRTRYIEGIGAPDRMLDAVDAASAQRFPSDLQSDSPGIPLAAGRYIFECEVHVTSETASVLMQIDDARRTKGLKLGDSKVDLAQGYNVLRYEFSKPFAPYQCCVLMTGLTGRMRTGDWKIIPRVERQIARQGDSKGTPGSESAGEGACFGGALTVTQLVAPDELKIGEPFVLHCGMQLEDYSFRNFGEHSVFVHWTDSDGRQAYVAGFSLARVFINGSRGISVDCGVPEGLKPGEYLMEMGIINGRTLKRLSVSSPGLSRANRRDKKIPVGNIRIY